jgi:hypothetical protein
MRAFHKYLLNNHVATDKAVEFYLHWVRRFCDYCGKHPTEPLALADIERFLHEESKRRPKWQIDQARHAIQVYCFWQNRPTTTADQSAHRNKDHWKTIAQQFSNLARLKHLSPRTEKTYLHWIRRFYHFVSGIQRFLDLSCG